MTILDDDFDVKEYNQAIANYSALATEGIDFAVSYALARYSCPTSTKQVKVSMKL